MQLDAISLRAGTKSYRKEVNRSMLQELQRFSTDESGQDLPMWIAMAVILVVAAVVLLRETIVPVLGQAAEKIKNCILCAMNPDCTSC